jgi:CRISPR-associated endonuclease Csn1
VDYNVGLDMGSNSIGWAVLDDDYQLLHIKGKNTYGVRLFEEGQTAAKRRGYRTTKRRFKRRKWRLRLLNEIFEVPILAIDPSFFARQKESNLVPQDPKRHYYGDFLFSDQTDHDFYEKYPTIYHLRHALMTEHRQFDIREVYWACHHIIKYRGHFLVGGSPASYHSRKLDLPEDFKHLNQLFETLQSDFQFNLTNSAYLNTVLLDFTKTRSDRQKTVLKQLYQGTDKRHKAIATEILKAILGMKANFSKVMACAVSDENDWKFAFSDEGSDEAITKILEALSLDQQELLTYLQQIYAGITLAEIVPNGQTLSQAMIAKYEQHAAHLKQYKAITRQMEKPVRQALLIAYSGYINGRKHKPVTQDEFYAEVTKALKKTKIDNSAINEIQRLIELGQFMPKLRTKANGVIPHQLQQIELDKIIENQRQYYPWLAVPNPNKSRQNIAPYKLDELVAFRVPYYVGPLITPATQDKTSGAKFAWLTRLKPGEITPWNFFDKIDRAQTAETFIKRMTTKDTYLLAEDVLPKRSLIYQKFEVLNELNNVKIDGKHIENDLKQAIYQDLFQKEGRVTIKRLKKYLISKGSCREPIEISGLADEMHFLSGLTTEKELRQLFGDQVEQQAYQADFEKMIEWATIFEDKSILRLKLDGINWLTAEQKNQFANKRYRGWGNLSQRLLTGLVDANQHTILDQLWQTTQNFMMIVNQPVYAAAIVKANQDLLAEQDVNTVINDLYTSPQNKKALRQIMLVMADLEKAFGHAPKKIAIEFARDDQAPARRSVQRKTQLEQRYQGICDDTLASSDIRTKLKDVKNSALTDRLFLYFSQGGVDLYTGESLNIDHLSHYDIDHILPQAFIKDDSIDNRVLVSSTINRNKSDSLPLDAYTGHTFGRKMYPIWKRMKEQGLMTDKKFKNLTFTPEKLSKWSMNGFVKRQLVETRQIIKLAANLLMERYQAADTKILTIKASMTHQLREELDFPKNRNVNHYHHAFDAYLACLIGLYLDQRYPKLRAFFTYGEFARLNLEKMKRVNFLRPLKTQAQIVDQETGEIIWQREKALTEMERIYNFKKALVTHEVTERHGALFGQTLFSAKDDQSSKLIPKKANMPTKWYGGYSNENVAFMSIVRVMKKQQPVYQVIGIPTRFATQLLNDQRKIDLKALTAYLVGYFTTQKLNRKTKKIQIVKTSFEVVVPKVRYRQAIFDDGQPFMLGSATYKYNLRELYLSKQAIKTINGDTKAIMSLVEVYDEILKQVNQYFPLYDMNQFRKKLNDGREKFIALPDRTSVEEKSIDKRTILMRILIGLQASAAMSDLKPIGFSTSFGMLQKSKGIMLSSTAKLIYQSPTGLYQRVVALADL